MSVEWSSLFHPVGSTSCPATSKGIPGNRMWKGKVPEAGKTPLKAGSEAAMLLPEPWHGALSSCGRGGRAGRGWDCWGDYYATAPHLTLIFPVQESIWKEWEIVPPARMALGCASGVGSSSLSSTSISWKLLALAITLVQEGGAGQSPLPLWGFTEGVLGQSILVWLCWALASEQQWLLIVSEFL